MKIYAFICPEEGEGILSMGSRIENQKPLVFKSKELAEKLIPTVEELFSGCGKTVNLVEFSGSKVLKVVCKK